MKKSDFKKLFEQVRECVKKQRTAKVNIGFLDEKTHLNSYQGYPIFLEVTKGKYKGSIMRVMGITSLDHKTNENRSRYSAKPKPPGRIHAKVDNHNGNIGKVYYVSYDRFEFTDKTKTELVMEDQKNSDIFDMFDNQLVEGDYVFGSIAPEGQTFFAQVKSTTLVKNKIDLRIIKTRTRPSDKYYNKRQRNIQSNKKFNDLPRHKDYSMWAYPTTLMKIDSEEGLMYDLRS